MSVSRKNYKAYEKFYKNLHEYAALKVKFRAVNHPYKVSINNKHSEFSFYFKHENEWHWSMKWLFFKKRYMKIYFNLYLVVVDYDVPVDKLIDKEFCELDIRKILMFCKAIHPGGVAQHMFIADFFKTLSRANKLNFFTKSLSTDKLRLERELFQLCT